MTEPVAAADDYPLDRVVFGPSGGVAYTMDPGQWKDMCAELDNLRRWKAEAMVVLAEWEQCYDILAKAGHPAPYGLWKSRHVAGYLKIAVDDGRVGR